MRYVYFILITFILGLAPISAQSELDKVILQGQSFEQEGNYQRAKYYYGLVHRLSSGEEYFNEEYQELSAQKVAAQDSLLAYESKNDEVRWHMMRFDSLTDCCNAVWQIMELERVIGINQALVHPKVKVDQLWNENPGITKQVRILQSKAKREAFVSSFKNEKKKVADGKKLEGYFGLKSLVSDKHPNEELDHEVTKLEKELRKDIMEYEVLLKSADSLMTLNELTIAKEKFNLALSLNSECNICIERLEMIDIMAKMSEWTDIVYAQKLQEARGANSIGEFLTAKRIYQHILNNEPKDKTASTELQEVEDKLKSQQEERQIGFKVKLLEERADAFFSKGEYKSALKLYQELKGDYADYVSDIEVVKERLATCEKSIGD